MLAADANHAWFCAAEAQVAGCNLYVTDGTAGGTRKLTTNQGVSQVYLSPTGELYFFAVSTDGLLMSLVGQRRHPDRYARAAHVRGDGPVGHRADCVGRRPRHVPERRRRHQPRGLFRLDIDTGTTTMITPNGLNSFAEHPVEMDGARYFIMGLLAVAQRRHARRHPAPHQLLAAVYRNRAAGEDRQPAGLRQWRRHKGRRDLGQRRHRGRHAHAARRHAGHGQRSFIQAATADRVFFIAGDSVGDGAQQLWSPTAHCRTRT
jgi:hypothetical protein